MFCGFLALTYSAAGQFKEAALAILFAILLDGLDGRVARRLNATSRFGLEFDSFSDLVSFGVAPAILVYNWCFKVQLQADEFGVLIAFIYAVCTACRLARFNLETPTLKGFCGLPSPGAAAAMAAMVYISPYQTVSQSSVFFVSLITLLLAFFMVSSIPYLSIKAFKLQSIHLGVTILIALGIGLLWYSARYGLVAVAFGYAFSGPANLLMKRLGLVPQTSPQA
jgi:CDP-diacylglycerol--serine O-phosphatidyltransferase